ncbi:transcription initiation factor IIF subunit alpha, partial [Tanacetum coccineum]
LNMQVPVLTPKVNYGSKRNNVLKEEPIDNSSSKEAATLGAARGTPTSKSFRGKRKSGDDAKTANGAAPQKKVKTKNEVKTVKEALGFGAKNSKGASSSSKPASSVTGPVTEDELKDNGLIAYLKIINMDVDIDARVPSYSMSSHRSDKRLYAITSNKHFSYDLSNDCFEATLQLKHELLKYLSYISKELMMDQFPSPPSE